VGNTYNFTFPVQVVSSLSKDSQEKNNGKKKKKRRNNEETEISANF